MIPVATVTKATILMELTGIRMAATIGERFALSAKLSPTRLYRIEMIQLVNTTLFPALA